MSKLTDARLDELAAYYDTRDMSDEIKDADWVDETNPAPMVTISLRLPAAVLNEVRAIADDRGVKYTAVLREWIEGRVAKEGASDEASIPVSVLQAAIGEWVAAHAPRHPANARRRRGSARPTST